MTHELHRAHRAFPVHRMSLEHRVPGIQMRIAADQKAWREQGRLLAYCSMSSGFGAW